MQDTCDLRNNVAPNVLNDNQPAVVEDGHLGFAGLPCKDFSDCLPKEVQKANGQNVMLGLGKSGPPAQDCAAYLSRSAQPFLFLENAVRLVEHEHSTREIYQGNSRTFLVPLIV